MELDKILDEMESIILEGSKVPLVNKIMIDEAAITDIMDKLRSAVPLEVKRAHDLLEEQKNIIAKSRTEADTIVEQAKTEGTESFEHEAELNLLSKLLHYRQNQTQRQPHSL